MSLFSAKPSRVSVGATLVKPPPLPSYPDPYTAKGASDIVDACFSYWRSYRASWKALPIEAQAWTAGLQQTKKAIEDRKASEKDKEDRFAELVKGAFSASGYGKEAADLFRKGLNAAKALVGGRSEFEEAADNAQECFDRLTSMGLPLWPAIYPSPGGAAGGQAKLLERLYCDRITAAGNSWYKPSIDLWRVLIENSNNGDVRRIAEIAPPFALPLIGGEHPVPSYPVLHWQQVVAVSAVVAAARNRAAKTVAVNSIRSLLKNTLDFSYAAGITLKPGVGPSADGDRYYFIQSAYAQAAFSGAPLTGSGISSSGSALTSGKGGDRGIGFGTLALAGGAGFLAFKFGPSIYSMLKNGKGKTHK